MKQVSEMNLDELVALLAKIEKAVSMRAVDRKERRPKLDYRPASKYQASRTTRRALSR